jgi:FG-GAP repeat
VGDFNGDGKLDLAVGTTISAQYFEAGIILIISAFGDDFG